MRLRKARTGEPIPVKSYNFWIYVREGEDWKMPGGRLGPNPGNRHARQQEFCTATGRNAVPDC